MNRKLLMGLLAFGAIAGFGHGFASVARCAGHHHQARREAFERHVADVCTRSAREAWDGRGEPPRPHVHADDAHAPF